MDLFQYLIVTRCAGGGQASGKITITENGTDINVAQYATADVAVPQPSGKITIDQNGTDLDIAQYATADVAVTPVLTPTLIDTIDIEDFAEQVNIVEIDPTAYDMTGYHLLWIEAYEVTFTASDWIYINTSGNQSQYIPSQSLTHSFQKCFFAKIDDTWRNLMSMNVQSSGRITSDGDEILTTLKKINLKPYSSSTKFASGRIYIYAY